MYDKLEYSLFSSLAFHAIRIVWKTTLIHLAYKIFQGFILFIAHWSHRLLKMISHENGKLNEIGNDDNRFFCELK